MSDAPAAGERPAASDAAGADALLAVAVEAARLAGALLLERVRQRRRARGREQEHADRPRQRGRPRLRAGDPRAARASAARATASWGRRATRARAAAACSWVVDPLDGTVNFLFGIPQWCVSVAVRDGDGTIAGAVYDPNRDELFSATRDGAAPLTARRRARADTASRPRAAHRRGALGRRRAVDGDGRHGLRLRRRRARARRRGCSRALIPRVRDIRRFGSAALDLAWTAAGRYDAYFERTVKQWDIAAGALICERAGLRVLELPLRAPAVGDPRAPPALAEPLLELVGGP